VINLATYIYDREWPVDVVLGGELTMLACVSGAALAPLAASCLGRGRAGALPGAMAAAAVVVSGWCVHRYMPAISETWSQRGLFDAYYADCTPTDPPERLYSGRIRCREPLIAYKMYWRGETWHSQNTVIPLRKDSQVDHFMSSEAAQDVYYALTERSRVAHQFRSELPSERQEFMSTVHDGNAKFVLLRIGTAGDRATVDGTASQ
jgi:hypothetical protein